jgi:hypothetical protein
MILPGYFPAYGQTWMSGLNVINMEQEIRFGIMCNGMAFPAWQAEAIQRLLALEKVSCGLVIQEDVPPAGKEFRLRHLFWYAYQRLSGKFSRSTRPVDLAGKLEAIPLIRCPVQRSSASSMHFADTDTERIGKAGLHFILRFGPGTLRGKILEAATFGIWSFHHGDVETYGGVPQCFWEIYRDDKITGAALLKLTDGSDAEVVLKEGFVKTRYSYARNRDQLHRETRRWPALLCAEILHGHTDRFHASPPVTKSRINQLPRNVQVMAFILKLVYFRLREASRNIFFTDYWNIGVAKAPISAFLGDDKPEVDWYPLRSRNRFLADPFGLPDDHDKGKLHIFYETYPYTEARGKLDYMTYEGSFGVEQKLIKEDFHLSYPYPLRHNGEYYLVPESYEANRVFMYRAVDFPLSWESSHILLDGYAGIDNTILKHEDTYWMFTTDKHDGFRHNLMLFYAEDLLGKWKPHPGNPVKTDIRSARPAGTPFRHNEDLYRPSMDYAEKIEGRIYINKIITLSKTAYAEIPVKIIDPYTDTRFSDKIHTLCDAGEYTILDGGREAFIFGSVYFILRGIVLTIRKLRQKLRR